MAWSLWLQPLVARLVWLLQSNQLGQAYASMEKGDFDAAEANLKKILQKRPTYSMAMQLLGHVYYRSERYQKAEEVYRQMIRNNEFDASAYNILSYTDKAAS